MADSRAETAALDSVRYPLGRATLVASPNSAIRAASISVIRNLPNELRPLVSGLDDGQLNRRYRDGGWTVRQIVHHLADEHLNAFTYFKMALTEDDPVIKPYSEPLWAETEDALRADVKLSLDLLTALHARWTILLESLTDLQFDRAYVHRRGRLPIHQAVQLYEWHCLHHVAHIRNALTR